jgi:hypothetical protein
MDTALMPGIIAGIIHSITRGPGPNSALWRSDPPRREVGRSHRLRTIEQLFAKLKAVIRRLTPRSREALFEVIGYALHQVSSAECANYLAHGGYGRSA